MSEANERKRKHGFNYACQATGGCRYIGLRYNVRQHYLNKHVPLNKVPYLCHLCTSRFYTKTKADTHLTKQHPGIHFREIFLGTYGEVKEGPMEKVSEETVNRKRFKSATPDREEELRRLLTPSAVQEVLGDISSSEDQDDTQDVSEQVPPLVVPDESLVTVPPVVLEEIVERMEELPVAEPFVIVREDKKNEEDASVVLVKEPDCSSEPAQEVVRVEDITEKAIDGPLEGTNAKCPPFPLEPFVIIKVISPAKSSVPQKVPRLVIKRPLLGSMAPQVREKRNHSDEIEVIPEEPLHVDPVAGSSPPEVPVPVHPPTVTPPRQGVWKRLQPSPTYRPSTSNTHEPSVEIDVRPHPAQIDPPVVEALDLVKRAIDELTTSQKALCKVQADMMHYLRRITHAMEQMPRTPAETRQEKTSQVGVPASLSTSNPPSQPPSRAPKPNRPQEKSTARPRESRDKENRRPLPRSTHRPSAPMKMHFAKSHHR